MIDETRIERALRQGPPFRTGYTQRPLPLGSAAEPAGTRRFELILAMVLLVVAIGGAALVRSGAVRLSPIVVSPVRSPIWVPAGSMITPRAGGQSVTLLDEGMVLAAGGYDGSELLTSAELFDPSTLKWTPTGNLGQARSGHTATLLGDGRVLVTGGNDDPYNNGNPLRTAELFDPATGLWTAAELMIQARSQQTATLLQDGRVLVVGGADTGGWLDSAELFDPATNTWTETDSLAQARGDQTATLLQDGRVLVVGGVVGKGSCCRPLSSAELFDPRTGTWTSTEDMVELRGGSTATLLLDGRVLVLGEINGPGLTSGELYDPATGSWSPTRNMIDHMINLTATLLVDGRVLVAAGTADHPPGSFTGLSAVEIYQPTTGSWSLAPDMHASRGEGQVAIRLADGRVLLVGGLAEPGVLSAPAAEVYDPAGAP